MSSLRRLSTPKGLRMLGPDSMGQFYRKGKLLGTRKLWQSHPKAGFTHLLIAEISEKVNEHVWSDLQRSSIKCSKS